MADIKTSALGVRMIMQLEGSKAVIYNDPVGLPTIGVGHLLTRDELSSGAIKLSSGRVIDIKQALSYADIHDILVDDLSVAEAAVTRVIKQQLNQHQFDALVSWAFNVGTGALERSTLARLLNAGDFGSVPAQLRRWDKAGGRVLLGLKNRRETEIAMWLGQNPQANTAGQDARPDYYVDYPDYGAFPTYDDGKLVNQTPAKQKLSISTGSTSKVQSEVEQSAIYKIIARFVPPGYGTNATALVGFVVGLLDIAHDKLMMPALPFIDYNIDGMTWVIGSVGLYFLRRAKG